MQVEIKHINGFEFRGTAGAHQFTFDTKTPVGTDRGPSPKEMMLASILGCSGMDVAGLLKKYKMNPTEFSIVGDGIPRTEHPRIFPRIDVTFKFRGENLDIAKLNEAVELSMTKYCGVSAMINPTSPIFYKVEVNGAVVAEAQAKF